jgi:hypothetical protein
MEGELREIWVYLSASPLLALTLTLVAYQVGFWIYRRAGFNPLLNPVLIAVVLLVSLLLVTDTQYSVYFEGAQFVHFMLGPATVALALPLYRQLERVRRSSIAILASLLAGSLTAAISAVGIAALFGASKETLVSLAPKSVTAPVAMGISEQLGGIAVVDSGSGDPDRDYWGSSWSVIIEPDGSKGHGRSRIGHRYCVTRHWDSPCAASQRTGGCIFRSRHGA